MLYKQQRPCSMHPRLPWERALHADASCGSEALSVEVGVGVDGVEDEVGDTEVEVGDVW